MSNPQVKNQATKAVKTQESRPQETPRSQAEPSRTARALASASNSASYKVTVPDDAFNVANLNGGTVKMIASGDVQDGEIQSDQVAHYALDAGFRRFNAGGKMRQESGELGTQSVKPEGHSVSESRFEAEGEADQVLKQGISRMRGGYV